MNERVPLEVRELAFSYPGGAPALRGVDLRLEPGTLTCLLGPNGSGKSTLLRLLGGLARPTGGEVRLGERDPARLAREALAREVAFLPARAAVPPDYTALEVVLMGRHPFGRGLWLERPEDSARARHALARVDAGGFAARPCDALSSGERQRVLLARTLCQDAPVLLLDEPTSAQDLAHALDLLELLAALAREGRTVVVATHDLNAAARRADRLVVLAGGRVVADGPPRSVITEETLAAAFAVDALLGEDGGAPFAVPRRRRRAPEAAA